jgi:outer membrane protein assembly factor BamB
MPTPIVYGDLLYTCSNQGVLTAYNAKTGERVYQERLGGTGAAFTASPVASDGKLYLSSEDGDVFVVKTGPKYELLAKNPVGEVMMATPAVSDGLLIVRTVSHIYAFGETPAASKSGN